MDVIVFLKTQLYLHTIRFHFRFPSNKFPSYRACTGCISHWLKYMTHKISVTTEPILIKLEDKKYLPKATHHAKPHLDAKMRRRGWSGRIRSLPLLKRFFLIWFLSNAHRSHQWTDFNDLYVIRRAFTQGCAFGCCTDTVHHLGGHIAQKPQFRERE